MTMTAFVENRGFYKIMPNAVWRSHDGWLGIGMKKKTDEHFERWLDYRGAWQDIMRMR